MLKSKHESVTWLSSGAYNKRIQRMGSGIGFIFLHLKGACGFFFKLKCYSGSTYCLYDISVRNDGNN